MKKSILLLLISMIAVSSFGAAVNWSWSSGTILYGTTKVGTASTAYLVYLGNESLSEFSFEDIITATAVDIGTTKLSKITGHEGSKKANSTNDKVGNYACYVTYNDGTDTYYNLSTDVYTLTADAVYELLNYGTALNNYAPTFDSTINTGVYYDSVTKASSAKGWYTATPIPEPATGALALAGLALLIRRRRV